MRKPDDSSLTVEQYRAVRREAERALLEASAIGRFPTPIRDIMTAAGVQEAEDDVLNPGFIRSMRRKAGDALKRAVGKVLGLLDVGTRMVFLDRAINSTRQIFLRLHETAHAVLGWQRSIYAVVEASEKSLDPDTSELFDREANVFASEVLFQLDQFTEEAEQHKFGIGVPLKLSKKYGASIYASVRRYVAHSPRVCCVVILDPPQFIECDGFRCNLRRFVSSASFFQVFGEPVWPEHFTPDDPVGALVPVGSRRMSRPRAFTLRDRDGVERACVAEAFTQTYQVFVLIHLRETLRTSLVLPEQSRSEALS